MRGRAISKLFLLHLATTTCLITTRPSCSIAPGQASSLVAQFASDPGSALVQRLRPGAGVALALGGVRTASSSITVPGRGVGPIAAPTCIPMQCPTGVLKALV